VKTGEEISREFGIPIVNKRISVTPIALIGDHYSSYLPLRVFMIYRGALDAVHLVKDLFLLAFDQNVTKCSLIDRNIDRNNSMKSCGK